MSFFICSVGFSYILDIYKIKEADLDRPAEAVLADYNSQMNKLAGKIRVYKIEEHSRNKKVRLNKIEKDNFSNYKNIKKEITFWKYVVDLKTALLEISKDKENANGEADFLSKNIIEKIYELSNKYRVKTSAIAHNMLINSGLKRRGFCYHYVSDILTNLGDTKLKYYDIYWGAAWESNYFENNSIIITAKGDKISAGIAIDPWRKASKPFFVKVKDDYFPWTIVPKPWPIQ